MVIEEDVEEIILTSPPAKRFKYNIRKIIIENLPFT